MIENISRYLEEGMEPIEAALKGAEQIGFTIITLTISLIAVLIPLLFMGDVVGRLFREFAVTLSVRRSLISAVVSLTLTPMMSSRLLRHTPEAEQNRLLSLDRGPLQTRIIAAYGRSLKWVLQYETATLVCRGRLAGADDLPIHRNTEGVLSLPKTPESFKASRRHPNPSRFPAMSHKQQQLADVILKDPAVASLSSFIGADGVNTTMNSGRIQINLKPVADRHLTAHRGRHCAPAKACRTRSLESTSTCSPYKTSL